LDVRRAKAAREGHTDWVEAVAFSPDGVHIAFGSEDNTICVWDARTGKAVIEPIQGHTGSVYSLVFSPDGARIASSSEDETIRVWDAKTGEAVMEPIRGRTFLVTSIVFSPDGERIASSLADKTICVWDARTGEAIMKPIRGHTDTVWCVAFSPDGAHIVSGSSDKTIRVWDARTGVTIANMLSPSTLDLSASPITLPHAGESWIRGPNQELIMWVPPEYRFYLQLPPHFIVMASPRVIVDMSRTVHGTDWVKCYIG
jgi:WD40 repeat protein